MIYTIVSAKGFLQEDGSWGKLEGSCFMAFLKTAISKSKDLTENSCIAGWKPGEEGSLMINEAADLFQVSHLL